MFKPHKHRERLQSFGFSFLLPSPCPGVFSSLGDSGVSSPRGGSRRLSGSQCQSLDSQTMLLCPADPVPGAARMPLGFLASPESERAEVPATEILQHILPPPRPAYASVSRPRLYSNTGSGQTNSCESNLQTRVQLTNFQQIAPSRVRPLGCPLLYIPSRPADLRVWTRSKQCASSLSGIAPLYRWKKEKKKVACIFLSLSRLLLAAWLTLAPLPGVTAIHRLSLCSDSRGRERE